MPKYMFQATYTLEGARGLAKDGAIKRRTVVNEAITKLGGKLDAFYFAFGKSDVVTVVDLPDAAAAAAASLAITAAGGARITTTVLLTPEEMEPATKRTVTYRAPGA
jgi:uncharacterized protein with GYD domain